MVSAVSDLRSGMRAMTGPNCQRAFTLNEVLIAVAVFGVVMGLVVQVLIQTMGLSRDLQARMDLQSQSVIVLDTLTHDLQSAHKVIVEDSHDPDHANLHLVHGDGSSTVYRWEKERQEYLRRSDARAERAGDNWRKVSLSNLQIEGLQVTVNHGLARIHLKARRIVAGTTRAVRMELTTQVQTLE